MLTHGMASEVLLRVGLDLRRALPNVVCGRRLHQVRGYKFDNTRVKVEQEQYVQSRGWGKALLLLGCLLTRMNKLGALDGWLAPQMGLPGEAAPGRGGASAQARTRTPTLGTRLRC